jgi:hypothetical protein
MQFFVKGLNGNSMTFDYSPTTKVEEAKKMVEERTGIPARTQRLLFGGKFPFCTIFRLPKYYVLKTEITIQLRDAKSYSV